MAIRTGQHLGPYEILSAIGAGGMGEVYRARDTRLDRIVAVKILPDHLADRAELRERFEREARTIASLNHPHICTLHDIGHQDGTDFLIMEYLEGGTLAERLRKGPLPLDQVLRYAIEIADALDKAHRKGITHRDLKPSNILLTKTGAKLLDFGLAKLRQQTAAPNISLSKLPTANDAVTAEGTIVGTLQYMAPEQLEGREVDARTDIFAFGVVVYEMATGKKAFEGNSQASVISAIMSSDPPPMSSLQLMTPLSLDRVVKTCLAKDADERWQAAGDLYRELKWIAEGDSQSALPPITPAKAVRALGRRRLFVGAGALLLVAAISGLAVWNLKPTPARPITRTVINLPPGDQLAAQDSPAIAISPDGTQLAYVAIHAGTRQIFLRALDSLEAKPLADTEGANTPFFSPDGQSLGFFTGGRLKKISVSGGAALSFGSAPFPVGATWGSNGAITFAPNRSSVVEQISDTGGALRALADLHKGDGGQGWPELLPGSKAVLFALLGANPGIVVQSLSSAERRDLVPGGTSPHYATTGHLIYAQGGNLIAAPFDPQRLQITGAAVPVAEGVLQSGISGGVQYALSGTGSLVYVPSGSVAAQQLVWVSRNGAEQALAAPPHAYITPRISPDGRRVAMVVGEQGNQIWLYDFALDTLNRLTFGGSTNQVPVWTPDGKRITFLSNKEGPQNIFWQPADGSGGLERLTTSEYSQVPRSFSPDGQLLAFSEVNPSTGYDIWVLRLSDRKAEPFLRTTFNESVPSFSPDGQWLAYISDESGWEVYVQPYPGPGGKYQISTEGGTEPVWNPKGKELFYRSGDKMMAVDITTQPSFSVGKPRMLFQGPYLPTPATFPNYDISPDGQRFLMIKPSEQTPSSSLTQIVVVQNWFEELKRRVPTGKK